MAATPEISLARHCGQCGGKLAEPGTRCAACGPYPDLSAIAPAAREEMLAGVAGDVTAAMFGPGEAGKLRSEALALQGRVSRLFDLADRADYDEKVRAEVDAAEEELDYAEAVLDALAEEVAPAIAAERAAEDRARTAAEHARQVAEREAQARESGTASPEVLTELLLTKDAAAKVAAAELASAGPAAAAREQAEAAVRKARAEAADRRRALAAVQARAGDESPAVPLSAYTVAYDWHGRLVRHELTGEALAQARGFVLNLARASGADDVLRGQERARIEREDRERVTSTVLPRAGHPHRPPALPVPATAPGRA
jgi:hypothetical protein